MPPTEHTSTAASSSPDGELVNSAKALFDDTFGRFGADDDEPSSTSTSEKNGDGDGTGTGTLTAKIVTRCAAAPGRVNLIGEHTDYTGGYVLPMAIGFSTVCYGRGGLVPSSSLSDSESAGRCRIVSSGQEGGVVTFAATPEMTKISDGPKWANYVAGVVAQYVPDVPDGYALTFDLAVAGNVPLGSGLSSSASLEVSAAKFVECVMGKEAAFSSSGRVPSGDGDGDGAEKAKAIERALRCQKAENEWCDSSCGIMDQFVSSAAKEGMVILIDCRIPDYYPAKFAGDDAPVVVVCNSNVTHSIAGGEYPVRVAQCRTATEALRKVNPDIEMLRDAALEDLDEAKAKGGMDDVIYRRARHVITENKRTVDAKVALDAGEWETMGKLMNGSHESMKTDYEVSCEEIDVLVDLAVAFPGVYGSRLTGGGFGGCTVTLVKKEEVAGLMEHLKKGYMDKLGKVCTCFETSPANGAREILL